ncbi:protein pitchfork, partial [Serinus canaria]|uniref:protein pitchfork n=1 Tax=Serinus canaria TaxID=9135 RepID=UPI0021CCC103
SLLSPPAVTKPISFGTTQERKMFPYGFAPDRLGIEVLGVRGDPSLGPGSYLGPESRALQSPLSSRPESSRGYAMGARTAPRFQPRAQPLSPGPAAYGPFPGRPRPAPPGPGPAPFGSSSPRFPRRLLDRDRNPGHFNRSPITINKSPITINNSPIRINNDQYRLTSDPSPPRPGTYDPREAQGRQVRWPGCFGAPDWARLPRPLPRMLRLQVQKVSGAGLGQPQFLKGIPNS